MHARLEELISLRDREPVDAGLPAHVSACTECSAALGELERMQARLRSLPQAPAPAGAWERIAALHAASLHAVNLHAAWPRPGGVRRPAQAREPRARGASTWFGTAAVIALAVLVAASPWWLRDPAPVGDAARIGELVARSQRLEAALHGLPERPAVEVAANSAAIDALQSRIQWVDAVLASQPRIEPERARALWQSRVRLLDSLVGVRYAEAVRAGYPIPTDVPGTGGT